MILEVQVTHVPTCKVKYVLRPNCIHAIYRTYKPYSARRDRKTLNIYFATQLHY